MLTSTPNSEQAPIDVTKARQTVKVKIGQHTLGVTEGSILAVTHENHLGRIKEYIMKVTRDGLVVL